MAESKQIIPQTVLRNLGEKSYEKRKSAALEIELLVKGINGSKGGTKSPDAEERVRSIIRILVENYISSTQANHRKGGLIAMAATAIALMEDTPKYLAELLPPVLGRFQDQDNRVRYYACEAMYNMTKVARGSVLTLFNEIFDGLCGLYSHPDDDVRNGAQLLDRLLKDVVTESEAFNLQKFIPLLRERIRIQNPNIRQLIVSWVTVLDSVPDIDMLEYLPEYLGGLFDMLSAQQADIRQQAYAALAEFLREITLAVHVEQGPMVKIVVQQCKAKHNFTRDTGLTWLYEFIQLAKTKLLPFADHMLGACLHCIADPQEEIRAKAEATNMALIKLLEATDEKFDVPPVLQQITDFIGNQNVSTRLASLRWLSMLLKKMPETIYEHMSAVFPSLLSTLSDSDDRVVRLDLECLARISLTTTNFDMVLNKLMHKFAADRKLLETRGSLVIRQLSVLLGGESIYRALARILVNMGSSGLETKTPTKPSEKEMRQLSKDVHKELEFGSLMVQTLNLILLTSAELFELRALIKDSLVTPQGRDLFITLYTSWCHNPVATFSLCLLAQAYELASALAIEISNMEVTVSLLMQIDKLVQLIESPIFIHLRLQLLEPHRHPFLLKSLLLMLLPQSSAFTALKTRLESVSVLSQLKVPDSKFASPRVDIKMQAAKQLDFKKLLDQFKTTQKRHANFRKDVFRQHRLPKPLRERDAAAAPTS